MMHTLKQSDFSFERLDVWRISMEALRAIKALEFKRFGDLKQQLERAALSIVANLSEGVGIAWAHYSRCSHARSYATLARCRYAHAYDALSRSTVAVTVTTATTRSRPRTVTFGRTAPRFSARIPKLC